MLIPRNVLKLGKVAAQNDGIYNEKAIYVRRNGDHLEALIHNGNWLVTVKWLELEGGNMEDYPFLDVTPKMTQGKADGWVMLQAQVAVNALKAMGKPSKHMPILDCLYLEEIPVNGKEQLRAFCTDLEQVGQFSSSQEFGDNIKGMADLFETWQKEMKAKKKSAASVHVSPEYVAMVAGMIKDVMPSLKHANMLLEPGIDNQHPIRISANWGGYVLTAYLMPMII
jgi:hypothetical protein